jgi:asparagine synthase (glutamine-hydrolysing)
MCGICGIYGIREEILIKRMLGVLKHRGPDDQGIYLDDSISLGHARLSIIDLSEKGRQPLFNEDGNIALIVNGEIYNFVELRGQLELKGHKFLSRSDSEVIVHAYEEYGLDFVNKLRGMFALALYDKREHKLVLARDPIGKKPLYYHFDGKLLIFASEIKALLETNIKKELNEVALYFYLSQLYAPGDSTMFKGIRKVPAGSLLILENNKIIIQQYWDIKENIIKASENYFVKELRSLLDESTRLRMVADVPVGAFLSGGIDSSSVVAMARPYANGQFHTFSVGFETFSELEYTRLVSKHLDTTPHELIITADMVLDNLQKIAWHYDEPIGDLGIVNNYFLSKMAKEYVKVILAGEGGDELLGGYPNYEKGLLLYDYYRMPPFIRKIMGKLINLIPGSGDITTVTDRLHRWASYLCQLRFNNLCLYLSSHMSAAEIHFLTNLESQDIYEHSIIPPKMKEPLNQILACDCKNLLPELWFMKDDKATMANSIEQRLPLMDKEFIAFCFSIPPEFKIRNGQVKYILKKAVADLLPPEILSRKKIGMGTPVHDWLMHRPMKEMLVDRLANGELIKTYFNKDATRGLINYLMNTNSLKRYQALSIWGIFVLELWYDIYFQSATC